MRKYSHTTWWSKFVFRFCYCCVESIFLYLLYSHILQTGSSELFCSALFLFEKTYKRHVTDISSYGKFWKENRQDCLQKGEQSQTAVHWHITVYLYIYLSLSLSLSLVHTHTQLWCSCNLWAQNKKSDLLLFHPTSPSFPVKENHTFSHSSKLEPTTSEALSKLC